VKKNTFLKKDKSKKKIIYRNKIAKFYNNLFSKYGDNPKALGRYDLVKSKKKFNFVYKHLSEFKLNKKINVLDIGCGIGRFIKSNSFDKNKINYTGIDIAEQSINYCKKKFKNKGLFLHKDIFEKNENSNFFMRPNKNYQLVFSMATIEHKNYLNSKNNLIFFLKKSVPFVKKGGYIIFDYFYKENLDFTDKDCNYLSLKEIIDISKKYSDQIRFDFQVSKFEVLVSIKIH
tara:strand:+ start:33 stop:725 length:693 start_codon:yes stop_codon:yes gene_type:complete